MGTLARFWVQGDSGRYYRLAGDRIEIRSAGSNPGDAVNPAAVEAMGEVGIDISAETPKILTVDAVRESDVCITMGCGDTCPVFPGKRYLDWNRRRDLRRRLADYDHRGRELPRLPRQRPGPAVHG